MPVTVELEAVAGSGQHGTARLSVAGEKQTKVVLQFSKQIGKAQPAHIHAGGCKSIGDLTAELADVIGSRSTTTVEFPLEFLQSGEYAIQVHESEARIEHVTACGVLPQAPAVD